MKAKHLLITLAVLLLPCFAMAQSATDAIFKKYAEQEGVESVIISGDMIKMVAPAAQNLASKVNMENIPVDLKEFDFSKIKSIKVLNFEQFTEEQGKTLAQFVEDADKALDNKRYSELMQVNSNGEKVKILSVKDKTMISELIVYRKNLTEKQATLIYVDGLFEEDFIGKIISQVSKSMK